MSFVNPDSSYCPTLLSLTKATCGSMKRKMDPNGQIAQSLATKERERERERREREIEREE
jgi:hypothetical protein